ncbi:MAG: oligoribonuclease [Bdellovibrionales bacterium]|jgi:oligoribonuclease|nr:oligoribonuclease [Bdellovibrionales bacterium]
MTKMLWLDMEMTGLDVEREVPIEVAGIIVDLNFNELETYHAVIRQPQERLDGMDNWNKEHHGASGLLALIPNGQDMAAVERDLIQFVDRHFQGEPAVLCGNSIGQDRLFINKYFPQLNRKLHYRMLDVTSWKVVFQTLYGIKFDKKNTHRAVDDIRESIAELRHYMRFIKSDL